MKIIDCVQGTPEWHEARRTHYRTASTASAMMGARGSRSATIRQAATGIEPEVSDWVKANLFDPGHEIEAMARPMAEEIIGEALYPVTATTDDGYLLASFDGITMGEDVAWECKSWNEDKVCRMLADGLVPLEDRYQVMQQLAVMGLGSRVLYMVTDGTTENCEILWAIATGNEYATLAPHWAQFDLDVENYAHVEPSPTLVGEVISALPSVFVQVEGRVVAGDMRAHRATVSKWVQALPSVFETDQDFVNGAQAVKDCANAEASLSALLQQVLGQMVEVDEVIRLINESKAEIAAARLRIDKLVKSENENRRAALVLAAHEEIRQHRDALNKRIGGAWMPLTQHPFGEAVKGLKSLKSMEDKLATAIAQAKVAESSLADRIQANHKAMMDSGRDVLMPDFAQVCQKAPDDFLLLLNSRIQADDARLQAAKDQDAKEEAERIAREQEAKARAEAMASGAAARQQAASEAGLANVQAIQPDTRAVVVESEAIIAQFLASREWRKGEETRIRAILVEFVKFQAVGMKKAA